LRGRGRERSTTSHVMAPDCGPPRRRSDLLLQISQGFTWLAHTPVGHDNRGFGEISANPSDNR
jgi:hypothetical protein